MLDERSCGGSEAPEVAVALDSARGFGIVGGGGAGRDGLDSSRGEGWIWVGPSSSHGFSSSAVMPPWLLDGLAVPAVSRRESEPASSSFRISIRCPHFRHVALLTALRSLSSGILYVAPQLSQTTLMDLYPGSIWGASYPHLEGHIGSYLLPHGLSIDSELKGLPVCSQDSLQDAGI